MKAIIDDYKGWTIWCEFGPGERFVEAQTWTAEKEGETVVLEAPTNVALRELIDMREAPEIILRVDPIAPEMIRICVWRDAAAEIPEDERKVLCLTQTKRGDLNHVLGYYAHDLMRWVCGMNSNVKYWMALPDAPKEADNDE